VDDRAVRYLIRALVVAAAIAALTAAIGARVVLSHGSGTYVALLAFLPALIVPGALVWRFPGAKTLAVWSLFGWGATIAWSIAGAPYHYERQLDLWHYVEAPVWVAIALVLFTAPVLAVVAMQRLPVRSELTHLGQRLRRVALVVTALAVIVIVTTFVIAGPDAFVVAIYTTLMILPAALVQREARPQWAWLWSAWSVPFAAFGVWLWLSVGGTTTWAVRIIEGGLGSIYVLLVFALPAICMFTRRTSSALPEARAL
jgi:hypothetical protein